MTIVELKKKYKKGLITKPEYIRKMHEFHKMLFAYSGFIKNTDIQSIEITDDNVMMVTRKNKIKFLTDIYDKRAIAVEILNFDGYEKESLSMILKLIPDKAVIFDIGANIGWFTLNIAKSIKNTQIYAFEPIKHTYQQLAYNLKLNNIENVKAVNSALGEKEGTTSFFYYKEGSGNASMRELSREYKAERVKGSVMKLDDFVAKNRLKRLDFLKCDVEGAELMVFKGGLESIKKFKPVIFAELLRKWSKPFGYHPNDVIDLLGDIGYKCFVINKGKIKPFGRVDEETKETNFFFI
jgi:FkbM family methyltransferase